MIRILLINSVFFVSLLAGCKSHYFPYTTTTSYHEPKANQAHRTYDSIIYPYKLQLDSSMRKVIMFSDWDFTKDGDENTLGNFICDALKWTLDSLKNKTHHDIIILMNRGGMRTNINKGFVTVNSVFELMPFDNELELLEIKGKDVLLIVQSILEKKHSFYGLKITSHNASLMVSNLSGIPIDSNKSYLLLTSDYLVNGGDNFSFGKTKLNSEKLHVLIRDAIIHYCIHLKYTGKKAKPYTDVRLVISK